jgi:hypothetical protein
MLPPPSFVDMEKVAGRAAKIVGRADGLASARRAIWSSSARRRAILRRDYGRRAVLSRDPKAAFRGEAGLRPAGAKVGAEDG